MDTIERFCASPWFMPLLALVILANIIVLAFIMAGK